MLLGLLDSGPDLLLGILFLHFCVAWFFFQLPPPARFFSTTHHFPHGPFLTEGDIGGSQHHNTAKKKQQQQTKQKKNREIPQYGKKEIAKYRKFAIPCQKSIEYQNRYSVNFRTDTRLDFVFEW